MIKKSAFEQGFEDGYEAFFKEAARKEKLSDAEKRKRFAQFGKSGIGTGAISRGVGGGVVGSAVGKLVGSMGGTGVDKAIGLASRGKYKGRLAEKTLQDVGQLGGGLRGALKGVASKSREIELEERLSKLKKLRGKK